MRFSDLGKRLEARRREIEKDTLARKKPKSRSKSRPVKKAPVEQTVWSGDPLDDELPGWLK